MGIVGGAIGGAPLWNIGMSIWDHLAAYKKPILNMKLHEVYPSCYTLGKEIEILPKNHIYRNLQTAQIGIVQVRIMNTSKEAITVSQVWYSDGKNKRYMYPGLDESVPDKELSKYASLKWMQLPLIKLPLRIDPNDSKDVRLLFPWMDAGVSQDGVIHPRIILETPKKDYLFDYDLHELKVVQENLQKKFGY